MHLKEEDKIKRGLLDKELTPQELFKLQDDAKKKAIMKYSRWKWSMYNENNVPTPSGSVVMKYDNEYQLCCCVTEEAPAANKKMARIQSARSGRTFVNQLPPKNVANHESKQTDNRHGNSLESLKQDSKVFLMDEHDDSNNDSSNGEQIKQMTTTSTKIDNFINS